MNSMGKSVLLCLFVIIWKVNFAFSEQVQEWIEEIKPNFHVLPGAELSTALNHNGAVVCGLNLDSLTRKENRFRLKDFNGNLCTHLVYSWFYINNLYKIVPGENFHELKTAEDLHASFPNLKILLEVSISNIRNATNKLSFMNTLTNSTEERKKFIANMIYMMKLLRRLGFAGIHLETAFYFYSNKQQFVSFAKELKDEFIKENLLITTEIEAHSKTRLVQYGGTIGEISRIFDLVFVRGFNFHAHQDPPVTGHNAPLYSSGINQESIYDNLKYIIDEEKADANSLVLGISLYGRPYLLKASENSNRFGFNEEVSTDQTHTDSVKDQELKKLKIILGYNEICTSVLLNEEPWKMFWDNKAKSPFIIQKNRWTSFENSQSIYEKVVSTKDLGLRGVMAFYIDFDDYLGSCSNITYPILKTVNYALSEARLQSYKMENPMVSLAAWGWISGIAIVVMALIVFIAYKIGRRLKSERFSSTELTTFMRGTTIPEESVQGEREVYVNAEMLPYDNIYEIPSTNYQIGSL